MYRLSTFHALAQKGQKGFFAEHFVPLACMSERFAHLRSADICIPPRLLSTGIKCGALPFSPALPDQIHTTPQLHLLHKLALSRPTNYLRASPVDGRHSTCCIKLAAAPSRPLAVSNGSRVYSPLAPSLPLASSQTRQALVPGVRSL
jgi:hypothetical protein